MSIPDRLPDDAATVDRASTSPGIRLTGADFAFGDRAVFANLALLLRGGAWTCVLGPSGVGKTTLLRLIAGIELPSSGTRLAATDGRPLTGRIAYMAQQDLLLPWLTVLQNVCLGARLRHRAPDHGQARRLLDRVGLGGRSEALPARLSGGERQRVALARTLMEDRPFVLMDEPFSALDAITRARLQDMAAELLGGRTVLLITHDPFEALRLGDDIFVMAGRPARLEAAPALPGDAPRRANDPSAAALHGQLLQRLRAAAEHA